MPLATTINFTARTPERTSILYYLRRLTVYDLLSLKTFLISTLSFTVFQCSINTTHYTNKYIKYQYYFQNLYINPLLF
ncbi:protein of unknown function [Clostridium beijerinckii]|nr:protein of unknown function [Clostridium beijerinckii]